MAAPHLLEAAFILYCIILIAFYLVMIRLVLMRRKEDWALARKWLTKSTMNIMYRRNAFILLFVLFAIVSFVIKRYRQFCLLLTKTMQRYKFLTTKPRKRKEKSVFYVFL